MPLSLINPNSSPALNNQNWKEIEKAFAGFYNVMTALCNVSSIIIIKYSALIII